jgi:hypothetical protein
MIRDVMQNRKCCSPPRNQSFYSKHGS